MFTFIFSRKSKSKSLLVGSSSAGSYPYPRVHTALMLIPNKRNQRDNIKENTFKRRPPLNKAIPTIPESKSNESIMSQSSRISTNIQKAAVASVPPDSLVIANRIAVEQLGRQTVCSAKAAVSPLLRHAHFSIIARNMQKELPTSTSGTSRKESREPPRSPLMSVAKSVKSKLTKLTRLGRSTERSSIKESQSFSGVRQKPVIVKKMDENANRVIKSSSMDTNLPISSNIPSTSRVVIPQNPEPLCSPDENRSLETRMEVVGAEKVMDDREVIGIVDYHVIMAPVKTVNAMEIKEKKEEAIALEINEKKPTEETSFVIKTEKMVCMTMTITETEPQEGNKENIERLEQESAVEHKVQEEPMGEEPTTEETSSHSMPRSVSGILEQRAAAKEISQQAQEVTKPKRSRQEETRSPPRYILTAKTLEASRKHQTFMIGEGLPKENTEPEPKEPEEAMEAKKKRDRSRNEEAKSPPRYILTAKTPITNRKQQSFVIGEVEPNEEVTITEAIRVGAREMKPKREKPEGPRSPPRYILTAKTPEMNRKHTTFMIGEAEGQPETEVVMVDKPVKKVPSHPEEPCSPSKHILTAKTPLTQRKQLAFSIGEKLGETVDAQLERTPKEKRSKMKRSRSEEPTYTKFIMKVKTPASIRRHHTFIVGERGKECTERDLNMVHRRLADFRQRSLSSQITGSQSFEFKSQVEKPRGREEVIKKREKKLLRQRSTPESEGGRQTRFILITKAKTPLPIRRCNTFMVGERAATPDVPFIEEGEVTEPIATVGPMAYKKRTKSEEPRKNEENEHVERFVMTVKTPLAMRKFQTFVVDEKPSLMPTSNSEQPITEEKRIKPVDVSTIYSTEIRREEMAKGVSLSQDMEEKDIITRIIEDALHKKESDYELSKEPIRPTDMYILTTTTPVAQRKNRIGDSDEVRSPLGGRLFVMGKRQSPVLEKEENRSQSDKAERRSVMSGELTSPEEEIPMDTMPSPLDNAPITAAIIHTYNAAPTFRAPSPPKYQPLTFSKSTSPVKSPSSYEPVSTSSDSRRFISTAMSPQAEEKRKKNKKEKNQMKAPLATRSLRSASKILTPSFFRKTKNKSAPVKSMSFPSRPNMNLNIRDKKAPLAEFESSVVGDSPLVENMPLTFEKWGSSPRNRRRYSEKVTALAETIIEESDGNGNPRCIVSPLMNRHEFNHSDLIDDEILDQPMLMGDNFSHSESSEVLARRATDYENERSTLVSIDRSYAEEYHDSTPNRRRETNNNNGNGHNIQTQSVASSRYLAADLKAKEELEDSLGELAAIKGALQHLQAFTNKELLAEAKSQYEVEEFDHLMKENDALRRELLEKDSLITQLKQQLTMMKQQTQT